MILAIVTMNKKVIVRLGIAVIVASIATLTLHIYLLQVITPIINKIGPALTLQKPPYPLSTNLAAYITMLVPILVIAIIYRMLGHHLPGNNVFIKGIVLGCLLLLIKGELLRQPLMNVLVGNPVWLALLQQSHVWLSNLVLGLIVVLTVPLKQPAQTT